MYLMLTNHLVYSFFASQYSRNQSWSKEEVYPKPCYPKHGLIYRSNFEQVSENRSLNGRAGQHQFRGEQNGLVKRLQTPQHRFQASSCQQPQPGTTAPSPTFRVAAAWFLPSNSLCASLATGEQGPCREPGPVIGWIPKLLANILGCFSDRSTRTSELPG